MTLIDLKLKSRKWKNIFIEKLFKWRAQDTFNTIIGFVGLLVAIKSCRLTENDTYQQTQLGQLKEIVQNQQSEITHLVDILQEERTQTKTAGNSFSELQTQGSELGKQSIMVNEQLKLYLSERKEASTIMKRAMKADTFQLTQLIEDLSELIGYGGKVQLLKTLPENRPNLWLHVHEVLDKYKGNSILLSSDSIKRKFNQLYHLSITLWKVEGDLMPDTNLTLEYRNDMFNYKNRDQSDLIRSQNDSWKMYVNKLYDFFFSVLHIIGKKD